MPQFLAENIKSVSDHASLSDHKYIKIKVCLPNISEIPDPVISSSSYWKLNTSILKDEDFLFNFAKMY